MHTEFKVFDPQEVKQQAGQALNGLLLGAKPGPVLLLLSGGSAFGILEEISPEVLDENITITMLDERFSLDPAVNNFSQLQQTGFYKIAEDANVNFLGTAIRPGETKEDFAQRWESRLKEWKEKNPNGKIIATFGMGPDGHTSGLLPYPENPVLFEKLFLGGNWVMAYTALGKNPYPERVTSTPAFFKEIDFALAFITGETKRSAFEKLKAKNAAMAELPALALYETKNLVAFTDIK